MKVCGGDGLLGLGEFDLDQEVGAPGFFLRGTELEQELVAGQGLLLQLVEASPELFDSSSKDWRFLANYGSKNHVSNYCLSDTAAKLA